MTREVFMPLLCADTKNFEQSDKLMDIMHRIITQIAVAQSQIENSVTLPLPALGVLSSAANNPTRRLTVLHILETTLINWQKQIKNVLKQQPEIVTSQPNFFTNDEIQGYIAMKKLFPSSLYIFLLANAVFFLHVCVWCTVGHPNSDQPCFLPLSVLIVLSAQLNLFYLVLLFSCFAL